MKNRVTQLVRDLGRVSGATLVELLVAHLRADAEGVRLARELVGLPSDGDDIAADSYLEKMGDVEHQGDTLRAELARGLSRALVTTIDREDLFRLSRSIDDVLDNVRDFVREWTIYGRGISVDLGAMLDAIAGAIEELEGAVATLAGPSEEIVPAGLTAKKACNQVRRAYQAQLGELFARPLDMEVLKSRELLRRLDVVGLRLDEAVDVLLDAAVKRGS